MTLGTGQGAGSESGRDRSPLLLATGMRKRFGAVNALEGVDLVVQAGEVVALLGENGAGKSTLVRCLGGAIAPDDGEMRLLGRVIRPRSAHEGERLGIATVHQEVHLIPHMTIAQNIALGREETGWGGRILWARVRERARAALDRLGVMVDVDRELSSCPVSMRQLVAIARALDVRAKVLILDEPTSSLERPEVERLFRVLRDLRAAGLGMVFISHFLGQVFVIADRVVVLRDGRLAAEGPIGAFTRERLVSVMIGGTVRTRDAGTGPGPDGAGVILRAKALRRQGALEHADLYVRRGEVVGLAGLMGSGRTELVRALFGAEPVQSGDVHWHGQAVRVRTPRAAIRLGLSLSPEDRARDGLLRRLSVQDNIVLALTARRRGLRRLSPRESRRLARDLVERLRIKAASLNAPVDSLSGGNQQKVLVARWLAARPELLLLDEPTRGIDVGAKGEMLELVGTLVAKGLSVVFVSSELDEVVAVSHRVVVMHDRRTTLELAGEAMTERALVEAISTGSGHA